MNNPIEMIYPDGSKLEQEYDAANRLVRFKNKRGQEITYDYDAEGRLASKSTPEGMTVFRYDQDDRLLQVVKLGNFFLIK